MLRRSHDRGGAPGRAGPAAALQPGVRSAVLGVTQAWNGAAPDASGEARPPALLDVAGEIAAGVHALVPSCSCAVVVQLGAGWQVVGERGRDDVAGRPSQGGRRGDRARQGATARRPGRDVRLARPGRPPGAGDGRRRADPGGGAGGGAGGAPAGRRTPRPGPRGAATRPRHPPPGQLAGARRRDGVRDDRRRPARGHGVALAGRDGGVPRPRRARQRAFGVRRLVRAACDLDRPAVDEAPAAGAILGLDARRRIAVPAASRQGAFVLETAIAGEELDAESVAAAENLVRVARLLERQASLTSEMRSLRREDRETGCCSAELLESKLEHALQDEAPAGDVALLVCQVDLRNAPTNMELAGSAGRALLDVATGAQADIFRMRPWRFAVLRPGASARDARLLAQRLCLAVRQLTDDRSCTASVGIALAPLHGATPVELVDAAEQAMNAAAESGGDTANVASKRGRRYASSIDVHRRLDALRTLECLTDQVCHGGLAHSEAVAQRAVRIAVAMGLDRRAVLSVQLGGELHEIGALLVRQEPTSPAAPADPRLDALAASLAGRAVTACGLGGRRRDHRQHARARRRHGRPPRRRRRRDPRRRAHPGRRQRVRDDPRRARTWGHRRRRRRRPSAAAGRARLRCAGRPRRPAARRAGRRTPGAHRADPARGGGRHLGPHGRHHAPAWSRREPLRGPPNTTRPRSLSHDRHPSHRRARSRSRGARHRQPVGRRRLRRPPHQRPGAEGPLRGRREAGQQQRHVPRHRESRRQSRRSSHPRPSARRRWPMGPSPPPSWRRAR